LRARAEEKQRKRGEEGATSRWADGKRIIPVSLFGRKSEKKSRDPQYVFRFAEGGGRKGGTP